MKRILFFLVSFLWAQSPEDILNHSAKFYQSLKTAQISFSQEMIFEVTGETQKNKGVFILGEGDAFRLSTEQIDLISDGVSLWEERKGQNQVILKALLDMDNAYHPSQILFRYLECKPLSLKLEGNTYQLKLDPRTKIRGLEELEVWLEKDAFHPVKITTTDLTGSHSTYVIEDFVQNPKLGADVFTYQGRDGVEILDMR